MKLKLSPMANLRYGINQRTPLCVPQIGQNLQYGSSPIPHPRQRTPERMVG